MIYYNVIIFNNNILIKKITNIKQNMHTKIHEIRGQKVMLDRDLADLYGVNTGNLNLAVKRNRTRFPDDFMFQLTKSEWESLRLQFEILMGNRGQHRKYLPHALLTTEP